MAVGETMRRTLIAAAFAVAVAGPVWAQGAPPAAGACAALDSLRIPADAMTLPTGGAAIRRARLVAADASGNPNGEYCAVEGAILPVDPAAPEIRFVANLPSQWNRRALQFGGGGYNGRIPNTTGLETHGLAGTATPLARGFLTFASDSGHQADSADDASFALNAEALRNIPVLMVYGDYIAQDPRWPTIRGNGVRFAEAVRAAGGSVDVVDLPEIGIRGNSHMIMMDRNSDQVADVIQDWLARRGLWR